MKKLFFLLAMLPFSAGAQTGKPAIPRLVVKANALALISPFKQAAAVAADIRLAPRISTDVSLGYFLGSGVFAQYKEETYRGPRLRLGMKYYYRINSFAAFHIGAEARYHDIEHYSFRNTLRQGGQYSEFLRTRREINTYGGALRAGAQFFGARNKRFVIEPYLGLGISSHNVSMSLPPDATLLENFEFFFSGEYPEGITRTADVLFGVHIGYAF